MESYSIQSFSEAAGKYPAVLLAFFVLLPCLAWLLGRAHGRGGGEKEPWRYLYSVLIYAACVPGMLAGVLVGYSMLFVHENLLQKNVLVYFLPLASMIASLVVVTKNVDLDKVPGFDRLSGLLTMLAVTFFIMLFVEKTRIWIFFGGSFAALLVLGVACFALLQWSAARLKGRRE